MRTLLDQLRSRWQWHRLSAEEREIHAIVAHELEAGDRDPELWADVRAESPPSRAEEDYVRRRVEQLRREAERFSDDLVGAGGGGGMPPVETGRWSPAYQRVLDATARGTMRFGLVYYLVFALIFAFAVAVTTC